MATWQPAWQLAFVGSPKPDTQLNSTQPITRAIPRRTELWSPAPYTVSTPLSMNE